MKVTFIKKRKKEKINLELSKTPRPSINKASDEEIYFERANYQNSKYNLDDCFDQKSKQERIIEAVDNFNGKYNALLHKYHFLKLFSRAALRNQNFNTQTMFLDKQINRFKRNADELRKKTDIIKYLKEVENIELEDVFSTINECFDFCRDLGKNINEYQNAFYPRLKMASFSICNDLSYQELENLNKVVNQFLDGFKNIEEAFDYITYNSGELIINTINALVTSIENSKIKKHHNYKYNYFLNTDFVMVLNFSEWVELFTKIIYVKRTCKDVELFDYLNFKKYYQELEKRYIIMLIYNEMIQK